jgi:hypothetical protein
VILNALRGKPRACFVRFFVTAVLPCDSASAGTPSRHSRTRVTPENDDERGEASTSVAGFRAAYVFDVSQTDGRELPHIGIVHGDPSEYRERLCSFANAQGISVEYSSDIAPARSVCSRGLGAPASNETQLRDLLAVFHRGEQHPLPDGGSSSALPVGSDNSRRSAVHYVWLAMFAGPRLGTGRCSSVFFPVCPSPSSQDAAPAMRSVWLECGSPPV